jgi:hypothetical protein
MIVATAATLVVGSAASASAAPVPADAPYAIAAVTAPMTASLSVVQEPAKGEVDVNLDVDDSGAWYANPFWIVLGVVALVVVVLLVALAGRGGGDTTVVR